MDQVKFNLAVKSLENRLLEIEVNLEQERKRIKVLESYRTSLSIYERTLEDQLLNCFKYEDRLHEYMVKMEEYLTDANNTGICDWLSEEEEEGTPNNPIIIN